MFLILRVFHCSIEFQIDLSLKLFEPVCHAWNGTAIKTCLDHVILCQGLIQLQNPNVGDWRAICRNWLIIDVWKVPCRTEKMMGWKLWGWRGFAWCRRWKATVRAVGICNTKEWKWCRYRYESLLLECLPWCLLRTTLSPRGVVVSDFNFGKRCFVLH